MTYPITFSRCSNRRSPSAASAPREALLSYKEYLLRCMTGERLGITTLAPANMPFSRPSGERVASAVVEGIKA